VPERADMISNPGAVTSGLMRSSFAGPSDEKPVAKRAV